MTDVHDRVGDDATLAPPPPLPMPETFAKRDRRFAPKRLVVTFVAVLAGVVGGTLVANALTNNNSSSDAAMGNWMSSYGSNYLDVSHDVGTVNAAASTSSLRNACVKLQDDVGKAQSYPGMPISSLESQWSVILSNLSTTANDCVKGVDQQNVNLLKTAQNHMTNAAQAYLQLVKAVQKVGG
ncbi:MAG: hypothetical protein ACLQRH_20545 [Acidimicrobiales bacterium]